MIDFIREKELALIGEGRSSIRFSNWAIAAFALFIVAALQFPLVWQRSIHWDEFYHYSQLHQLANGALTQPLQTLHARFFSWVLEMPGNGIDHTIIIRFAMLACEWVAALAIGGIAARFTDRTTGCICAAAYISGGFVFQHGFSFRADPMAAALLMSSLWILLSTRLSWLAMLATGALLAVAAMITIKIVLFAPAFAGIVWLRWNEKNRSVKWLMRLFCTGIFAALVFVVIYWLHSRGLTGESDNVAKGVVSNSASKMFGFGQLPYLIFGLKQVLLAPVLAAAIIFFPATLFRHKGTTAQKMALAGLFAPVFTLFFYHNTAPYYYTFMLPPVVAAVSIVVAEFRAKFGTLLVAGLFVFTALMLWSKETDEPIRNQRTLMAAAEKMFPGGVAYFDFCAFLGEFPKANAFMTPWGIELYKAGFYPAMTAQMVKQPVPLVMDNDPMFKRLLERSGPVPEFIPADAAAVRDTYIPLWGPYWIAGRRFAAGTVGSFIVRVPGPYTVRGGRISIDGRDYFAGDVVELARGEHQVSADGGAVTVVWGKHIEVPKQAAPSTPFWTPF